MTYLFRFQFQVLILALFFWLERLFPLFTGRRERLRHAAPNLLMGLINGLLGALFFSHLTIAVIRYAEEHGLGLRSFLPMHEGWKTLILFGLFDLWMYVWHRLNHRANFLWRFHRMHHTDGALDSTSAFRFHFGEIAISSTLRWAVIALLGMRFRELLLYELVLQPVILFHHSNVALPEKADRILRMIIVTPNMHRVHHSNVPDETDSNYSSIFSFWDRLFGSFRRREDPRTLQYGLPRLMEARWQTVPGLLKTPFAPVQRRSSRGS